MNWIICRGLFTFASFVFVAIMGPTGAQAQSWPERAVRFILPFGAGSGTDTTARLLSERLTAKWRKPVIIENRPGADGLVAINAFVSANDDHILLYASSASFMAHPYTQEKLSYDLDRDLAPIAQLTDTVMVFAVPTATGIKTLSEFVARARAEPTKYNVSGSAGVPEFVVAAFAKTQNLGASRIPYRDSVQAGHDLGEDRIQFLFTSFAVVRPLVEAGKVTVIAVASQQRSKLVPNAPTAIESGFPELATQTTAAFYGPKGMPIALRQRIGGDVVEVVSDPVIASKIAATGQDIRTGGPEVLAATLKQQAKSAANVAKILGMQKK